MGRSLFTALAILLWAAGWWVNYAEVLLRLVEITLAPYGILERQSEQSALKS